MRQQDAAVPAVVNSGIQQAVDPNKDQSQAQQSLEIDPNNPPEGVQIVKNDGDQGCERIVVAESDLLDRYGVVLVDDRDDTEFEQTPKRVARVQIRVAIGRVAAREQHERDRDAVQREERAA